jgi:hypothetical protein
LDAVPLLQISSPCPPLAAGSEKTLPCDEGSDIDSASKPVVSAWETPAAIAASARVTTAARML